MAETGITTGSARATPADTARTRPADAARTRPADTARARPGGGASGTSRNRGASAMTSGGTERPPAPGMSTARQVRIVILVALLTALLLDSAGFVNTGQGTPPGLSRTLILAVGTPLDAVARALHFGGPKRWLDAALGHPDVTTGGGGMESGPALQLPALQLPAPAAVGAVATRNGPGRRSARSTRSAMGRAQRTWVGAPETWSGALAGWGGGQAAGAARTRRSFLRLRHPTKSDPLRVLVTGDSLCSYIGQQLAAITAGSGLVDVTTTARDGTGLTDPGLFNWEIGARQEVAGQPYDAVVMVVGANDGWPMRVNGRAIPAVASSAWLGEYARRIVTVEKAFTVGSPWRQVLWVGPPVARSVTWAHIFARLNSAARFAAPLVPGGQYLNIAGPTSADGRYTDYLSNPGGRPVLAREPDGIHFTYDGSLFPARIILNALEADFGGLS
jgi:uncharacterized protein